MLDLGCGSGILGLAAAKALRVPVLAADLDREAVRVTRANAKLNACAPWLRAIRADGLGGRALQSHAPFDLILANILAKPLKRMGRDLVRSLAPGGIAVLSGLLVSQEREVLSAYRGLRLIGRKRINGWSTLTLRQSLAAKLSHA